MQEGLQKNTYIIADIIQDEFAHFFGSAIHEEFDIEQVQEFRDSLRTSPQNYEQIIYQKLGFNKKYKQLVENLKKNESFMAALKPVSIKPIHRLMLNQMSLGKNTNLLYLLPLEIQMEWSLQNIIKGNDGAQREMLKQNMKKSQSLEEFFLLIEDYFLDCCIRRLDITQMISNINRISIELVGLNTDIRQTLKKLTCSDFVRIYSHFYPTKSYFGEILHKISLPLPILFTSKSQKIQNQFCNPQLLSSILGRSDFNLITNIGTSKMIGKGKTSFLEKMFFLKQKTLSNAFSYFHEGSIDFYTKVPQKINDKSILLADFHGDCLKSSGKYCTLLQTCLKSSTVVFIHLTERQGSIQTQQNASFLQKYNQFIKPLAPASKTIILIRDCRYIDQQAIFQKMNELEIIKLPNFTQLHNIPLIKLRFDNIYKHMQTFQSQKSIDSSTFLSPQASIHFENDKKEVDKLLNLIKNQFILKGKQFYESSFPNLYSQLEILNLKERTIKYEIQIKRAEGNQSKQLIKKYNEDKTTLTKLMKIQPKTISQLVKKVLLLLQKNGHLIQLFASELSAWRSQQTETFLNFIISKKAQFDNLNRRENSDPNQKQIIQNLIKQAQESLQSYDISLDTIFSQVIAALSNKKNRLQAAQAKIIGLYYQQSYKNITPINIIEGKTLIFGNPFLQKFFEELNRLKYANHQVFVVSVVGAQSSAKSTILNYIFRCNFATSVGRCTKGVYFTIVQCEQKTIVVVDTQGLLSVAARDHTFDIQIACFVMLISDLVIINNKGEVDATLRDLLGVCIYAIDQINSTSENEAYQPNKIIFTIRDQVQYGGTKQQQMLSMIIKSLNENTNLKYSNYIDFTEQDIYPLQSAYITQNEGNFCFEGANNTFGKSIINLRARIMNILKKAKNKTLMQFYSNSKRIWEAIQNCGENIFNFKTLFESRTKEFIKQILENVKKQFYTIFFNKQQGIVSKYFQKEVEAQSEIQHQLKVFHIQFKRDVFDEFNRRCEERIAQRELYRQLQYEIQQFCTIWYRDYLAKFKKRIIQIKFEQQNNSFKRKIKLLLAQSIASSKSDFEIIHWLQEEKYNLKQTLITEIKRVEAKQKTLGVNQDSHPISKKVGDFLKKYHKKYSIQYDTLIAMRKKYLQIQKCKIQKDQMLLSYFQITLHEGEIKQEQVKKDKDEIIDFICNFLNDCEKTVNSLIKFEFNADINKIEELMQKIMEELVQDYQIFTQNISRFYHKYKIKQFQMDHMVLTLSKFISTFPQKFEKTYYETSKSNLQAKIAEQQKMIDQLTKEVKESLSIKGNNKEMAKAWIKKLIERELDRCINYHRLLIQRDLNEVCSILNPRDIIREALIPLRTSPERTKQRWIKCYKIIKNLNKYLKQFLYNRQQINSLDYKLSNVKNESYNKIENYLNFELKTQFESMFADKMRGENKLKGIEYYEKELRIDLAAYKSTDIQQRLDEIFGFMKIIVDKFNEKGGQYEYFRTYITIELDDKIKKLKNHVKSFIIENIEPIVVGCNARCPGCGMKCYKTGGHIDGHELLMENHVLQCFNGKVYHETSVRSSDMCFTSENIFKKYLFLPEENVEITVQKWIEEKHPDWLQHFLHKSKYTKNKDRGKQLNIIWANIEYVLIRFKFNDMIPDPSVRSLQFDPLEQEDIINLKLEDY